MADQLTAAQVVERIRKNIPGWNASPADVFVAGSPDIEVTGIVTTWTPTFDVLRKAVAQKRNLIISRENPFWERGTPVAGYSGAGSITKLDTIQNSETFKLKHEFITSKDLTVYRLFDNWNAKNSGLQFDGLKKALDWQNRPLNGRVFTLNEMSLEQLARAVRDQLKIKGIRVLGKPDTRITRVALTLGFLQVPELESVIGDASVDAVIAGEPVEWEAAPYFHDLIYSGQRKGMIVIGQAASEEPGIREMAGWLKTFVNEVPVEFIPAGEPFWVPGKA
jgi:putative NIF3 family GTP cyclohydrolase 1 type 2